MSDQLLSLIEKYRVSPENTKEIFDRFFLPELKHYRPSNDPVGVIVGGQPGAGKSQILNIAKEEFRDNIVICNADDYRKYHPNTKEILRLHEQYYPDITTKLAQDLNLMLRNACKKQGLNFALEITMRDGGGANATINGIKSSGFTCNVDLIAVNDKWSRLGTVERLEAQRATEKYGRIVSPQAHDDRYKAMPQAVKEIADKKLYDNIRVFGRALMSKNDRIEQQVIIVAVNPSDPASALVKERNRPFTTDENIYYSNLVQKVAGLMKLRNALANEIAVFKSQFLPAEEKRQSKGGLKL